MNDWDEECEDGCEECGGEDGCEDWCEAGDSRPPCRSERRDFFGED